MNVERRVKPAFAVIGREGSTLDGPGFVQRLWDEANAHFSEIQPLVKRDEAGRCCGFWGAMTDFSRAFRPWTEGFTQGLYLAGAECADDAEAPEGWSKWVVPGFEYLAVESDDGGAFEAGLAYLAAHGLAMVGAAQDFVCPATGKGAVLFPIRRL